MAGLGRWEEFPTLLGGRIAYTRYRLKRPGVAVHPKVKRFRSLGWVISLDLHLGRWGLGFWPVKRGSRPGLRWVEVRPRD